MIILGLEETVVHKVWTRKGYNVSTKEFNKSHMALRSPKDNMNSCEDFLLLLLHTHAVAAAKVIQNFNPKILH